MNDSKILGLLKNYQQQINQSFEEIVPRSFTKNNLESITGTVSYELDPEAINLAVNKPVWDLLDRGGKRWRPVLFLTILDLLGKDPKDFIKLAAIFELIHNGSLIVDDIEDLSKARRGKPTVHLIYGEDISINAGNALYFLPYKILNQYQDKLSKQVILKIYQTCIDEMINLHFGQATDIAWHKGLIDDYQISESKYLQMCAFKTGGLSRMCAKIAAAVAQSDERLVEAFGKLGESLGVVFQIQDDILNITKNELSDMKGIGDDITEGKRSLPVIYALTNLPKDRSARLINILLMHTNEQDLIQEAIGLIEEGEGIKQATQIMTDLFDTAWGELSPLVPEGDKKDTLYDLARFLINRQV